MLRDFTNSRTINERFVGRKSFLGVYCWEEDEGRFLKSYQQIMAGYKLMKMSAKKETSCPYCLPASSI